MKHLKKLLVFLVLMVCACTTTKLPYTQEYDNIMLNEYEGYYTPYQLDSICVADTLEPNLNNWHIIGLRDDETKENVSQYLYIKTLGEKESIYRVQKIDDNTYKITKRVTK